MKYALPIGLAMAIAAVAYWLISQQQPATVDASSPDDSGGDVAEQNIPAPVSTNFSAKVVQLAQAIAKAEGFGVAGAVPTRGNNPGDLTKSFGYATAGTLNAEGVLAFVDLSDGWNALYAVVAYWLSGSDSLYPLSLTIEQVAGNYVDGPNAAGFSAGAENWSNIVANQLGLSVTNTLQDFLNS
jgi:hypothetical protein